MANQLSTITLAKLKAGDKRREIPDGRGLYFVVQTSGQRSWHFRYRFGGRPRNFTIGPYTAIDLKTARAKAAEAKAMVAAGNDPGAEKKASRAAAAVPAMDLVEAVADQFIKRHGANLAPATRREIGAIMKREIVPAWGGRKLSTITRPEIHNLLDGIAGRAPIFANLVFAWFRKMCNWARERGLLETNPCTGIGRPARATARERVLSDDELVAVWRAAEELGRPYCEFIKSLVLTGARRSEIAGMRWSEIDLAAKVWTLPKERSKNKRANVVPLSDLAVEALHGLPRIGDGFVFTVNGGRGHITNYDLIKKRLDARMPPETPPWVIHDLRRVFATGLAKLGIAVHITEACLNHKSGTIRGVAAVYNKYSYDTEKRSAMAAWANYVERLVTGAPDNVVPMARRS